MYKAEGICKKCGKRWHSILKYPLMYKRKFCNYCGHARSFTKKQRQAISSTLLKGIANGRIIPRKLSKKSIIKQKETYRKNHPKSLFTCPVCGKERYINPCRIGKQKYCSGTCRNYINNPLIKGSVSKVEKLLRNILIKNNYKIETNNRVILDGLEIDIWIPILNTGIEYNGVYHFWPIRGVKFLRKIQVKDKLKIERAKEKGINLIQISDIECTPQSVKKLGEKLLLRLKKIRAGLV